MLRFLMSSPERHCSLLATTISGTSFHIKHATGFCLDLFTKVLMFLLVMMKVKEELTLEIPKQWMNHFQA